MCKSPLHEFLHALPKCEHHAHLEGALTPAMIFSLAEKNQVPLPDLPIYQNAESLAARYKRFTSLDDFLNIHSANTVVLVTEDDFHQLAWTYFTSAHADGVMHAEAFFDLQSHTSRGVDIDTVVKGFGSARHRAERELGMSTRLIMCFMRNKPIPSAEETLQSIRQFVQENTIHGVGLDSSETGFPPDSFAEIFATAAEMGLHRTAHAGEEGGVSYIKDTLRSLRVQRVDHGIKLVEDPGLMQEIASNGTLLTICPLSNLRLQNIKSVESLPLREFLAAGVQFSINSDDQAYFGGGIMANYCAVQEAFNFSIDEWTQIAVAAINGSWVEEERKQNILRRLKEAVSRFR